MAHYWIGTSGYNYQEWKGSFYPEEIGDKQMLPFYAARFPTVEFRADSVRLGAQALGEVRGTLQGTLTLHGHTRSLGVPIEATVSGDSVAGTGSVRLRLSDFGIKPASAALGTVSVKDEIVVSFRLVAQASDDQG